MPVRIVVVSLAAFLLPASGVLAQEWTCVAPQVGGGVSHSCDSGKGSWVIVWDNGKAQGGCITGRDVALFTLASTQLKEFPIGQAVAQLTQKRDIEVKVLGNPEKLVTFTSRPRPLQLVLLDLQRESGVALDAPWLPQIGPNASFSMCVNARASDAALLIHAVSEQPVDIPREKKEIRVVLKLKGVDGREAGRELLKALP